MKKQNLFKVFLTLILSVSMASCGGSGGSSGDTSGRLKVTSQEYALEGILGAIVPALSFSLTLVGSITPPTVNGTLLEAADITLDGTVAFVSYNKAGNTQKGGIDLIQTLVPALPVLLGSRTFESSDIHGLARSGNTLYAVGAETNTGAVLHKVDMALGILAQNSTVTTVPLRSYAGTGVAVRNSVVYTTSGDGSGASAGGIDFFNPTSLAATMTGVTADRDILDVRAISYNSAGTSAARTDSLYLVSGKSGGVNAKLYEYSNAGALLSTTDLGGTSNAITQSKSSVSVGKTMVAVSQGENGFQVFCAKNKASLLSVGGANETPTISLANSVTNSVAVGPGLIFASNGEAGVYVYAFKQASGTVTAGSPCGTGAVSATLLGKINFGSGISANNVKYLGLTVGVVGVTASTGVLLVGTTSGFKLINLVQANTATDIVDFN